VASAPAPTPDAAPPIFHTTPPDAGDDVRGPAPVADAGPFEPDAAVTLDFDGGPTGEAADAAPAAVDVGASLPDAAREPPRGLTRELVAELLTMRREPPPPDPTNRFADDAAAQRLGHRLFFDVNLSRNGLASCSGCHDPDRYFSGILTYDGHGGLDFRQPPSLIDVAQQPWFFWDGRADSLWAQVRTPLESPDELNFDRVRLARFVHDWPLVRVDYETAFGPLPDEVFWARIPARAKPSDEPYEAVLDTAWAIMAPEDKLAVEGILANVGKALAAFQGLLVTPPSPFDVFLDGLASGDPAQLAALDDAALRGLRLFMGPAGCANCHAGPTLSDGTFHNLGLARLPGGPLDEGRAAGIPQVLADRFNAAGPHSDDPEGERAQRLGFLAVEAEDLGAFRTATLRNVTETWPYMHDGRFRTLEEAVVYKTSLPDQPALGERDPRLEPYPATPEEVADLVAFLRSLTAPPVEEHLRRPLP
jgi:cytochrome c peroxidase